jgi:alkyl hydroperoxide reductase subunit AhpC
MKFNTQFYSVIPDDNIYHEYLIYEKAIGQGLSKLWFSILPDENSYVLSVYETCEETGHLDVRNVFMCLDSDELIRIMEHEYHKEKSF